MCPKKLKFGYEKMSKVIIALELSSSFVRLLQANLTMRGVIPPDNTHMLDVLDVLGLVVLGESMGAKEEDIREKIPDMWISDIDIVPKIREVKK